MNNLQYILQQLTLMTSSLADMINSMSMAPY